MNSCIVLCYSRPLYASARKVGGKERISAVLWDRIFLKSALHSAETYDDEFAGNLKLLVNINHLFFGKALCTVFGQPFCQPYITYGRVFLLHDWHEDAVA